MVVAVHQSRPAMLESGRPFHMSACRCVEAALIEPPAEHNLTATVHERTGKVEKREAQDGDTALQVRGSDPLSLP